MADTVNDSISKLTNELKDTTKRQNEAVKAMNSLTSSQANQKTDFSALGTSLKGALGVDKLVGAINSIPGIAVAAAAGALIKKKFTQKKEFKLLAKQLRITDDQLKNIIARKEVEKAQAANLAGMKKMVSELGGNADRIESVNAEGIAEFNGMLHESNGHFAKSNSETANAFSALFNEQKKKKKEPTVETVIPEPVLEKLASENTLLSIADKLGAVIKAVDVPKPPKAKPAKAAESSAKERKQQKRMLKLQEEQNKALTKIGNEKDKKGGGGFMGLLRLGGLAALIPALVAGFTAAIPLIVAGLAAFAAAVAPFVLIGGAIFVGILGAIAFIKGFMEGFDEGGIFGGLQGGLMEMFDWLIGFPLQLLKDITVWALNLLGMENMAKALDEFPLVETIRSMFKTIVDIIIIPLGFLMASAGTILTGLFDTLSSIFFGFFEMLDTAFVAITGVFEGIGMIFSGDILGGFNLLWSSIHDLIMAPINFIVDSVRVIFSELDTMIMGVFDNFKLALDHIFGPTSNLSGLAAWITSTLGTLWDAIKAPFLGIMDYFSGESAFSFEDFLFGPDGVITNIFQAIQDIFPSMEDFKAMLPSVSDIIDFFNPFSDDEDEEKAKSMAKDSNMISISRSDLNALIAQRTQTLQGQGMDNRLDQAAMPGMMMQQLTNNNSVVTTINRPIAIPTPISNPNDSYFNPLNWF